MIEPWIQSTAGTTGLGLLLWAGLGLAFTMHRAREERTPYRGRGREAARRTEAALTDLERAERTGDVHAFFSAARRAIGAQLGFRWAVEPETITTRELRTRWPDAPAALVSVLEASDRATYAHVTLTPAELCVWHESVRDAIAKLEDTR